MDEPEEPGAARGDELLYEEPPAERRVLPVWLRCVTIALLIIILFNLLAFLLFEGL